MNNKAFKAIAKNYVCHHIFMLFAAMIPFKLSASDIFQDVNAFESNRPVAPYFSPANTAQTNLIVLMDQMNQGAFFDEGKLLIEDIETYQLAAKNKAIEKDIGQNSDGKEQKNENKKADDYLIPASLFYLPSNYIELKDKQNKKTLVELEQFGVEATARTINSLNELKRFNQTVVQDSLIDNLQKQLLISLRGAIFSYHFSTKNTDKQTLTTNDIITNKIQALSGDERVGEYKGYLLALDAYKNKKLDAAKQQFSVLIEAKHVWIAESAKYMLIQIAIDEFEKWLNEHEKELSIIDDKSKKVSKEQQDALEQLLEEKIQKIQVVERLVNAYQKRYPSGIYLMDVKLSLFNLLKTEKDPLRLIRVYQMESAYYEELLLNPIEYEDALRITPKILEDVLIHFPFAVNNPIEKLSKDKAYVIQPVNPLLDFIDAIKLLDDSQKQDMNKKQIEKRIDNVAFNLENIGHISLADYLRVEAKWKLYKDANKTLAQIDALNLSLENIHQSDIFSIYMIKVQALKNLGKAEEIKEVLISILNNSSDKQPLSALKQVYLELKLLELADNNKTE